MGEIFEKQFQVGWRDVDPNGYVASMVYLEYSVDTRIVQQLSRRSAVG
ncbi:MAG: hypothetical protein ABI646_02465 [Acidobacteriota bacterium]